VDEVVMLGPQTAVAGVAAGAGSPLPPTRMHVVEEE
jgi:hypothetical protein